MAQLPKSQLPKWVWVLVVGALLLLPQLSSYGLWDPSEIRHADQARELLVQGTLRDVTVGGKHAPGAVLPVWLAAAGFKLLGTNELAGRLPFALFGLLGLLIAYYTGRRIADDWSGLAAAFVLAAMPGYLMQARQLGGDVTFHVGLLAATGGLLAWTLPADGRRRRVDLVLAGWGLVVGVLSGGLLLGWLLPLLSLVISGGSVDLSGEGQASACAIKRLRRLFAPAWPGLRWMLLLSGLVIVAALLWCQAPVGLYQVVGGKGWLLWSRQGVWLVLGGVVHGASGAPGFDEPLRQLAYTTFPWFALLPLVLGTFVVRRDAVDLPAAERLGRTFVVACFILAYLASAAFALWLGGRHFAALPLLALGMGLWLRRQGAQWRDVERRWPFGALIVCGLLLALQQDFSVEPQTLAFSHLLDNPTYPIKLDIQGWVRLFGFALAAVSFIALAAVGTTVPAALRPAGRWAMVCGRVARGMTWLTRACRLAFPALSLVFAIWSAHWLIPQLSLHMSNKALFETYHRCLGADAKQGQKLGQYGASGRGAAYYTDGQVEEISSQSELLQRLRAPERFFAVIPSAQLGTIDQSARRQHVRYYVLDARSSKYLIISNQLGGTCSTDKNPLREMVLAAPPPKIGKRLVANFENLIKLIGYDCPDVVRSGSSFKITLYYQVLGHLPPNYKIFLHFDKPASRFNGDHAPLDEMYPTQYWLAGDYIVDTHEVELPLLTTPPGDYTIYTGLWLGEQRLKVVEGPNDGVNRVKLGHLRVAVY